jgi:ankyrin repeat protein
MMMFQKITRHHLRIYYFCFSILLEHVTDVDIYNLCQLTALHVAVKCSIDANVHMLLEGGANPNSTGHMGETPLHKAKSMKIVQMLLAFGADQESDSLNCKFNIVN